MVTTLALQLYLFTHTHTHTSDYFTPHKSGVILLTVCIYDTVHEHVLHTIVLRGITQLKVLSRGKIISEITFLSLLGEGHSNDVRMVKCHYDGHGDSHGESYGDKNKD